MGLMEVWRIGYDLIQNTVGIWFCILPPVIFFLLVVYRMRYPARQYKKEGGTAYVRHGRGNWKPLFEHMEKEHSEEYAMLKKQQKE